MGSGKAMLGNCNLHGSPGWELLDGFSSSPSSGAVISTSGGASTDSGIVRAGIEDLR